MTPEQEFANMILNMTTEEFNIWADKMSIEELDRVTYTIHLANQQLREQMECMEEELECEIEDTLCYESETGYFSEAQSVLSKFTLKGIK